MDKEKTKSFKILILYFSGTGNTYYVAKKIKDSLKSAGMDIDTISYEKCNPADVSNYDVLIFGFPVYGYSMPTFIKKSLKDLKKPKTKAVFIFATYALHPGNALRKSAKLFKKYGFVTIGTGKIKLPGSDGTLFLKEDSTYIKKIDSLVLKQNKSIKALSEKVKNKLTNLISSPNPNLIEEIPHFSMLSILIEILITPIYIILIRWAKTHFYVDQNCTHCGICQKLCPSNNIIVTKDKVIFDNKCFLCLRCINQCPEKAIQIGRFTKGKYRYKGPTGNFNPLKNI